ncbi:MAG TPA: 3-isopropylmalate dehydratase small subunit [Burkholderiales bacterium]|nr:3-isopropylmalate dehydratase small subunit [Burkholderiales bacterium]
MEPIKTISGVAIPLVRDDVDTDRLIPIRFLRKPLSAGYGNFLLADDRFDENGREKADFVFNHPQYRGGTILVSGKNFGCGSAREGAVYAVRDYGIRAVVASGFSDIFRMNCCWNGVLPVTLPESAIRELWDQLNAEPGAKITVDLEQQTVTAPKGNRYTFEIDKSVKERLMAGLDDVGVTQQFQDRIDAFEKAYVTGMPWIAQPEA